MHDREDKPQDDQQRNRAENQLVRALKYALCDDFVELKTQNRRVGRDAPKDLKEHRVITPENKGPPEIKPLPNVEKKSCHDEEIAQ